MPKPQKKTKEACKRIRLAPAARRKLILDAALIEFGEHGFRGASTKKIAQRAGLSQAGLYAHFGSKEAILESLLEDVLSLKPAAQTIEPESGRPAVKALIGELYAQLADPRVHALMRVVIMEGSRMPHLIKRWQDKILHPQLGAKQDLIRSLVGDEGMQRSSVSEIYQLFWSPIAHALILHLMLGDRVSKAGIAALQDAHLCMLADVLTAQDSAPQSRKFRAP